MLENIFDKEKVQAEIDLQVKVTQQFDRTRQDMKQIINQKIDEYKDKNPDKAKDWQNAGLLLDMLAGGLSSPGEGFLGSLAGTANPAVAQMIKGMVNDGTLKEGGLGHILAHGIAGAAMAAANGGDLLSGALTAGGAEALAPIIAEFLYGKKAKDLTADEKNTLSAIIGILGTGTGALTGDSAIDAVIGDSVATNAVENNQFLRIKINPGSGEGLILGGVFGNSLTTAEGEALAALLDSIVKDWGYKIDAFLNPQGEVDTSLMPAEVREEVSKLTSEMYKYSYNKRDSIYENYFTDHEFGQTLGDALEIIGIDIRGNPVYSASVQGAGDWINQGDKVVLSDNGQTWDVYTEDGYHLTSLNIDGTKSKYLTDIKKGSSLVFNPVTSEDFSNTLVTIPPKVDNQQGGYTKPETGSPNHTGDMSGSGKVDTGMIVGGGNQAVDLNDLGGNVVSKEIILEDGFYQVEGLKISKGYYDRLWEQGRPAPFLQAKEILSNNPVISPDPRGAKGYYRYETDTLEMIYNPTTGQIGHIQPIRKK